MSEWIKYSDKSPSIAMEILASCVGDEIVTMKFCLDIEQWVTNCKCSGWEHEVHKFIITHWMPLPNPPEEKNE